MSAPLVQPVYLAVPSHPAGGTDGRASMAPAIASFIDHLARNPVPAEGIAVGVVEFSTFVHEICALGTAFERAAQVSVSGFEGVSYASVFAEFSQLVDYDRHLLNEQGTRAARPIVAMIVDSPPDLDDVWGPAHASWIRPGHDPLAVAPVITAVGTTPAALAFAELLTFPVRRPALATDAARAGALAASTVLAARGGLRGIGDQHSPHITPLTKGSPR